MENKQTSPNSLASDIKSYLLDDELLIFSKSQQRLFHLNTVAAFIWCCLEEKLDTPSIIQSLVKTFGISIDQATNDLSNIIDEWVSVGLLISGTPETQKNSPPTEKNRDNLDYPFSLPDQSTFFSQRIYHLIDSDFLIRYANKALEDIIHPLFKHLEVAEATAQVIVLDILTQGNDYVLFADEQAVDFCTEKQTITPMMHANVLMLAYEQADCLLAIHAGAVSKGNQCILMPAVSGSGKSTLTAALITEGYGYCTDDLALLSNENFQIQSAPVSLGIKEGAWPILATRYPNINDLPTFMRLDGKVVRYLPPQKNALSENNQQHHSVKHIIFPKYQADAQVTLNRVSTADSLCRLTESGYDVGGNLEVSHVDDLIQWIRDIQCYTLEYSSLTDAIEKIKKLF